MGQTRGPSTRASGLDGRRARAQADETHAIFALADIIAKGNALVHFGAPAGYTNSSFTMEGTMRERTAMG